MDRLCEYDQINIFKYLDQEALQQCTEVIKAWAHTIGTNSKLMSQLPLVIKDNFEESQRQELMNLRRHYNFIVLEGLTGNFSALFESLSHILSNMKTVEIRNCDFSIEAFSDFLCRVKAVEKLSIFRLEFPGSAIHSFEPSTLLPTLKSLHLESPDWSCLNVLAHSQITDLALVFEIPIELESFDIENPNDCLQALNINSKVLENFFESQKNLTTLRLNMFPISLIGCLNSFEPNYGLKRLTLTFYDDDVTREGFQTIIELLQQHKSTLEFLEIWKVNEAVMIFIWKNLRLKELIVHNMKSVMSVPKWIFAPNHHLKKLCIGRVRHRSTKFFAKALEVFGSIQHLVVKRLCSKDAAIAFEAICTCLPSIRHLELPKLIARQEGFQPRIIPSLESLEVGELAELEHQERFFIDFRGIETLSIGIIMKTDILQLSLPDTKHLKVGVFTHFFLTDYDTLAQNCPKLRFLEFLEVGRNIRQATFNNAGLKIIQKAITSVHRRSREFCCSEGSDEGIFTDTRQSSGLIQRFWKANE